MSPRTAAVPVEQRSTVARRIIAARAHRGWRQSDLAAATGVHHKQVANWETDVIAPSLPNIIAVADALEVCLDWLVGRTPSCTTAAATADAPNAGQGPPGLPGDHLEQTECSSPIEASTRSQLLPPDTAGSTSPRAVHPGVAARGDLLALAYT